MNTKRKIFIGGLGALTPVIMNLLVVDLNVLFVNLTFFSFLGYLIRVIVLFYLGGLVAYLHKDEKMPIKVFELGIVAPALITALINASNVEVPQVQKPDTTTHTGYHLLVSPVYAQTDSTMQNQQLKLKTFSMPRQSIAAQFFQGVFGKSPKRIWFVVAGEHLKLEEAQKQAKMINEMKKEFKAEIYKPYGDDPHYRVVIGENMLYQSAKLLQKRAMSEKISEQIILWTFPKKD